MNNFKRNSRNEKFFISFEQKHEIECGNNAEQEEREQEAPVIDKIVISDDEDELLERDEVIEGQNDFLAYFALASSTADEIPRRNHSFLERSISPKKKKRPTQRTRKVIVKKEKDLEMAIPFSSPAGVVLTKKNVASEQHIEESLEFIETYCPAKPTIRIVPRVRQRLVTGSETAVIKDMRKPRNYSWPKRHGHSQSREENFEFLNRSLIQNVQPCSVSLLKLSENEIKAIQDGLAAIRAMKKLVEDCVDLCSDSDGDSVVMDDDVDLDQPNFIGEFFTDPMPGPSTMMMPPEIPSLPQFSSLPLPNNPEVVIFNRSQSYSTSTNSPQLRQINFMTTAGRNIMSRMKRASESDVPDPRKTKRSIQKWIQNVSVESYTANQVSVVNSN
jgi:hypothetical protein